VPGLITGHHVLITMPPIPPRAGRAGIIPAG
jgi:hypothetical protein